MPDWESIDPKLHEWTAEGLNPVEMCRRLGWDRKKRQTIVDRLRKLGLKEPQQSKVSPTQKTPMSEDAPVEVLEGPIDLEEANTPAPVLPTGNNLPVINQSTGPLSADESGVLEYYERIIETGVKTFVEVGHALTVIRDQRLYREHYATFDAYVRKRWDLERTYAHRIIEASEVVDRLLSAGNMVPVNEAQARPLASLPPEQQAEVWLEAVQTAPPSGITAKHVQETVKRAKAIGTTPPNAKTKTPKASKLFDVQDITTKLKDLYMDWLKHCETDDALETAQFFLNTLSDLAQGRAMQLQRR
jgi:hypothetical protein